MEKDMAIHKERGLSPLKDKPLKKKEEKRIKEGKYDAGELSYEGGIDAQQEQLHVVPKKIEDQQNTAEKDKLE